MVDKRSLEFKALPPIQWLRLRKISQILFFIIFIVFFLWARREFYINSSLESGLKEKLLNLPLKLDPLVMIAQVIASRKLLTGSLLALVTLVITLLLGRVWCGWFCPMGSLLDWIPLRTWKQSKPSIPESFRGIKYVLLLMILFAAVLTNLTLLIFDPLTIFYRTLTTAVWPALDQIITAIELALLRIPILSPVISSFDSLIRPAIFPAYPAVYRYGLLYFGFFLSLIALNILAPRFWCRYLCPLGGLLGLLGKVSLVSCEISSECTLCEICIPHCPTGAIQTGEIIYCDPGECTMCMDCAVKCQSSAVTFPAKYTQFLHQPYDIGRRKALLSLGTATIGVGLLESNLIGTEEIAPPIRPPGVVNEKFLSTCIRCGECSTVCPTNAIQMAVFDGGVEGFWTPIIVPRIGYCDYSCQACGQVCPVEAIPPLALEEKRTQIIGKAEIDRSRCLPWAEDQPCIVCEEMCPTPDKAITLEEVQISNPDGEIITLQRPSVIRKICIGCGICEYKCPINNEAAIQVTAHTGNHFGNQHRGK